MVFFKQMSLIYWVRNTKTDAELVLSKYGILSPTEAITTFAFARQRISMIITTSISSVPLAIGTRI